MSRQRATAWRRSLLVVGLLVAVCSGAAVAATDPVDLDPDTDLDGNGTAGDPFNVTNASELQAIAGNLTAVYQLNATINATNTTDWDGGNGFDPIGNSTHEFNGSLDGNGYEIQNLTIDRTSDDVGLFGFVGTNGNEAKLTNLTLTNVNVTGGTAVGALVGNSTNSAIDNVTVSGGNITGSGDSVGGLVGVATSQTTDQDDLIDSQIVLDTVTGVTNVGGVVGATNETGARVWIQNVSVTATVEGDSNVGGLLGNEFLTSIRSVTSDGTVTATSTGTANAGGLVGRFTGSGGIGGVDVYESSSNATVSANGANVGGLLGLSEGRVSRAYATGNVTGASRVGGLFGTANNTGSPVASSAFATGNVTAQGTAGEYFGGLIGDHRGGRMQEVYATGSVAGDDYTGGLIGSTNTTGTVDITDAYAAGNVSGDANTGGLLGYRNNTNVVTSHWDEDRTGQSTSAGGNGLQTEDMIGDEAEIRMPNFDFGGTWEIINESAPDATADGYPILAALDREPQLRFPDVDSDNGNDDNNDDDDDDTGGNGGGGGGSGGEDDDGSAEKTVTDDGDTEVTGGKSGDVIEFGDETTGSSSITGLDNIAVDGLSVELANDRDFFISVETYERGEEDEVDATAEATGEGANSGAGDVDSGTNGDADEDGESAASPDQSITASFERQTETVSVGYVTVTHNLEPEDIAEATFEFSVRDVYLDDLDVDPENVSLYRQTDRWSSLPTDFQERSQGRYRFEADSPGFSSFAIGTNAPLSIVINGTLGQTVIQEGQTATALATVNNRGQNPVTHTVNLTADGETVATETVTVDGGEIAEVPVAFAPSAGEYAMAVDEVPIGSLTVTETESRLWWLLVALAGLLLVVWWRRREDDEASTET